jgi:hypothetical protein
MTCFLSQAAIPDAAGILVLPWGLDHSGVGPWWIALNGTGIIQPITSEGALGIPIRIPARSRTGNARPTGVVFNDFSGFDIGNGLSVLIIVTEEGTIAGWNPLSGSLAVVMVSRPASCYKGVALLRTATDAFLYATDFANCQVDQFDANWNLLQVSSIFA